MEKADTEKRAKVILATVKGDVHDIGKNLVEIILKNNGYDVINLGIKVPPEELIRAHREHHPDAIGLSGLLVKSAQQMVITAADLREAGISRAAAGGWRGALRKIHATENRAAVQPGRVLRQRRDDRAASDERIERSGAARERIAAAHARGRGGARRTARRRRSQPAGEERRRRFAWICRFLRLRISIEKSRNVPDLNEIWSYVNPYMLFGRHLGFRGNFEKALAERDRARDRTVPEHGRNQAGGRVVHEDSARCGSFSKPSGAGTPSHSLRRETQPPVHTFHFQRQRAGRQALPERLHSCRPQMAHAITWRCSWLRPARAFAKDPKRRKPPALSLLSRPAGARDRNRRSLRGMAASAHTRGLGLSRSADDDHGRTGSPRVIAASATASAIRRARISRIRPASGCCCGPKKSACT